MHIVFVERSQIQARHLIFCLPNSNLCIFHSSISFYPAVRWMWPCKQLKTCTWQISDKALNQRKPSASILFLIRSFIFGMAYIKLSIVKPLTTCIGLFILHDIQFVCRQNAVGMDSQMNRKVLTLQGKRERERDRKLINM